MALLDPYAGSWTSVEAAHLARRTTFGATPDVLTTMVTAGMSSAVDSIVDYQPVDQPLEDSITALPSTTNNDLIKNPVRIQDLEIWGRVTLSPLVPGRIFWMVPELSMIRKSWTDGL